MKEKIVVFEEIHNYTRPLVEWYLLSGYDVYYFRLNGSCKDKKWIRRDTEKRRLIKIESKYDMVPTNVGMYPDPAHDNIEKISKFALNSDPVVKTIVRLYGDRTVCDIFKKNLEGRLERFYYLNFVIHNLNKAFPNKKIYFVPTLSKEDYRIDVVGARSYFDFLEMIQKSGASFYDNYNIAFSLWFRLLSRLYDLGGFLILSLKVSGFLILNGLNFLAKIIKIDRTEKKGYRFGIMVISPEAQFTGKIRNVDFLIDGNEIRKEDVLFISLRKLSLSNRHYLRHNNLAFVDGVSSSISLNASRNAIWPTFILLGRVIPYMRRRRHILEGALLTLAYYVIWMSFKEKYHVDNLISYCDYSRQSIARNLLLSEDGTKTWYYLHSTNLLVYFFSDGDKTNFPRYQSAYLTYLNYDYLLAWSAETANYFKKHHQSIKNYVNIGCLWAEHVREIENGKIQTDFKERLHKAGLKDNHKLVAVFDSTYFHNSIVPYEDGINFLKEIFRMLEEMPEIFMVFKEKKARNYVKRDSRKMIGLLNELERHPRCHLPLNITCPSEIIAFSDLTISFPFTSPTFEAISARKKAIYYDVSGKFRGTFYDRIPGLVCHNYDELHGRVKELLFAVSKDEYDAYLENNIKNKVETYLDGKAISRFRRLLTAGFESRPFLI